MLRYVRRSAELGEEALCATFQRMGVIGNREELTKGAQCAFMYMLVTLDRSQRIERGCWRPTDLHFTSEDLNRGLLPA
jgi:hypothetical protein